MLYDPIFSKSFSRFEQQKIRRFAFLACAVIALSICTVFKPQYHVRIVSSINLQFSRSVDVVDIEVAKDKNISDPLQYLSTGTDTEVYKELANVTTLQLSVTDDVKDGEAAKNVTTPETLQQSANVGSNDRKADKGIITSKPEQSSTDDVTLSVSLYSTSGDDVKDTYIAKDTTGTKPLQSLTGDGMKDLVVNDTLAPEPIEVEAKLIKLACSLSEPISDYCEIKGDIRIHPNSSTIFVVSDQAGSSYKNGSTSFILKPYARKGNEGAMGSVKSWTIKVIPPQGSPSCTTYQNIPAILFSLAGYSGNHFHDFSDIIIPLFSTSRKFDGQVHFLASDYKSWWSSKYRGILEKLSRHRVNDIDKEEGILCYKSMIIGLKTRKELGIDHASNIYEGFSMKDFRDFLRSAYSLTRKTVMKLRKGTIEKPRMMIISRKKTRTLINESKVTRTAQSMGYEVIVADATLSTDLSKFAELVNSCSVLIGVHGAGLTNMVFLPDNAVVIQIVPLGIEWYAKHDFEEPALDMNIRYMGYKIKVKESSLIQQYSVKSATIRNSLSVNKSGWDVIRSVYLDKQNVIVDVRRFRSSLLRALKLLHQ
ncbi:beta-1,2-xylosyltransferase XYXT1-like [Apium graveolens]|uniref:beta-1,2-xylosyltransferase XYXT1-like n=1 Tax=Apium graveolens TaxID=4045 RepID=UPI003D7B88A3